MGKHKTYKTFLGIPLWLITGLSLFAIFSVGYDLIVGDRNYMRYILLIVCVLILIISITLKVIPARYIQKMAGRQLGH